MTFGQQTPEQRAENIAKAQAARLEQAALYKQNEHLLKLEYMDNNHWAALASKYRVRMPVANEPCTVPRMRKYLKRVGITNEQWKDAYTSLDYFVEQNCTAEGSAWTLLAFTGLALEIRRECDET